MARIDTQFTTLTCDICKKTVTFEVIPNRNLPQTIIDENPWIKSYRPVLRGDGVTFGYCSDLCEIAGIETKQHNIPEAPKVDLAQGSAKAQIEAAAAAAKAREEATKAMKEGAPAKVHLG
jgi:hypothetical protein